VLTRRRVSLWLPVSLVLVSGLSFLVGHFAARPDSGYVDWELASIFGTALGTTGLAVVTGLLAYTTSGDVRGTWELARLTREDQRARERPVVVVELAMPQSHQRDEKSLTFILDVANIGLGPAMRGDLEVEYEFFADDEEDAVALRTQAFFGILPVDGRTTLKATFYDERAVRALALISGISVAGTAYDRNQRPTPVIAQRFLHPLEKPQSATDEAAT